MVRILREFHTPAATGTLAGGIELAQLDNGRYVTRRFSQTSRPNLRGGNTLERDYYWGHYFEPYLSAEVDYHERVLEWLRSYGGTLGDRPIGPEQSEATGAATESE